VAKKYTIVTLDDKDKYYLADEKKHKGVKYFLANELENYTLTNQTFIFTEIKEVDDIYLEILEDENLLEILNKKFAGSYAELAKLVGIKLK